MLHGKSVHHENLGGLKEGLERLVGRRETKGNEKGETGGGYNQ